MQLKRAKLNPALATQAVQEGDVLRACTATNIVYPAQALAFGLKPPTRCVVCYGADGQRWPQVIAALQKGLVADGPVTLVLERRVSPGAGELGLPAASAAGSSSVKRS